MWVFDFQYCEYYPDYEGCKKWLEEKMPEKFSQLGLDVEATGSAADDAKKPQKRGGKGKKNIKFCCYSIEIAQVWYDRLLGWHMFDLKNHW